MLRVFKIEQKSKIEVFPVDGIYTVFELGSYEFQYYSDQIITSNVFIEDMLVDQISIETNNSNILIKEARYFEDYFGYSVLNINNKEFLFNIKIEKLKLPEIENIFIYLWSKESSLLNVFFSKSSYKLDFKKNGFELEETSKILSFLDTFIKVLKDYSYFFQKTPHTVMRTSIKKIRYDSLKVTSDTLHAIVNNLDDISFDESFKGHYNAIEIRNKHGLIDMVDTLENINSLDNYENQVILGSFLIILKKLSKLKKEITANVDLNLNKKEKFADFRDLKKLQFIKLFEDSTSLEKQILNLFNRYRKIFPNVVPKLEKPYPSPIFATKMHYKKVFELIKNITDYKFNLNGEFNLLNINKLSTLYEVYCLYTIIDTIQDLINLNFFNPPCVSSSRVDNIIDYLHLENDEYSINLFYEAKYFGDKSLNNILLRRIDNRKGNYYNPDFILELKDKIKETTKYFILDAKYSKKHTVCNNHTNKLIYKYILNTGIVNNPNKKINALSLIFPGEFGENIIQSSYYEPTIDLINTRPASENELKEYIGTIFRKNLPKHLIKNKQRI